MYQPPHMARESMKNRQEELRTAGRRPRPSTLAAVAVILLLGAILTAAGIAVAAAASAAPVPATAAAHAPAAGPGSFYPQAVRWADLRNCRYKVTVHGVGDNGFRAWINTDTCDHPMWAVARCYDGVTLYGTVRYRSGAWTATSGGCGAGNIGGLRWWGIRDKQFVTHVHMATRLHCLSAAGSAACNT